MRVSSRIGTSTGTGFGVVMSVSVPVSTSITLRISVPAPQRGRDPAQRVAAGGGPSVPVVPAECQGFSGAGCRGRTPAPGHFLWLLSPVGSPAVTPASAQVSPVFSLPPTQTFLLKGPPRFPRTRRHHTSNTYTEETPTFSFCAVADQLSPAGSGRTSQAPPLGWAASTTGLQALSLPPCTCKWA